MPAKKHGRQAAVQAASSNVSYMKWNAFPAALVFALVTWACGRSPMEIVTWDGGVVIGGAGGGVGTEAVGGIQGTGGGYGGAGGSDDCPPCIADVINACVPLGECVTEAHGSGLGNAIAACYDNGVRTNSIERWNDLYVYNTTLEVTLNGNSCYSVDRFFDSFATETFTFKDGTGKQLASGTVDATGSIPVDCNGKEYAMKDICGDRSDRWATNCLLGTCR